MTIAGDRLRAGPIVLACLLAAMALPARAADEPERTQPAPRPRVTLVLSGGGARGAAHVGVLEVIEKLRIPIDLIVGTSMGAIVGGLYATGWTPEEIEHLLTTTDFSKILVDRPDREDKSFRRKLDDREFLIPLSLRFKGARPYIPRAALGGQRLEILLRTLEIESTDARDFDDFPIPYRAVAADLTTGEAVVLGKGSLATAMRASMSIAGLFAPVVIDDRPLVDGGAAANLPVGIARDLGAGPVIAVDITTPLSEEQELISVFSILDQMTGLLTLGNRLEDLARLGAGDVLIRPELGEIGPASFDRMEEAIGLGKSAARASADSLRALSVDEETYAAYRARRRRRPSRQPVPEEVRLENTSWVADEVVRRKVHVTTGEPLDVEALNRDIRHLHALEYFDTIRTRFENDDGRDALILNTPSKPYGRNSLQFGVNFHDDFEGGTGYALAARHQALALNRRGGEWQNIGQIGDTTLFDTSFYQPLDHGMKWFVEPGVSSRRWSQLIWLDDAPFAEYRLGVTEGRLAAGRVLGRWGEARISAFHSSNSAALRTGLSVFPDFHENDGGLRLRFRADTLDDIVFPERGLDVDAAYSVSTEDLGADSNYRRIRAAAGGAMTFGKNTFVPRVEYGEVLDGPLTIGNTFYLGGLLRLSGLGDDELYGSRYGLGVLVYYRELGSVNLGALSPKLYVGCSLEAGNTYQDEKPSLDTLNHSGSVFLGARTPLGPVYIAFALADGGRQRVLFNIGSRF